MRIKSEVARLSSNIEKYKENIKPVDYLDTNDTNISLKVVKIIQSYVKIINKVVWEKK